MPDPLRISIGKLCRDTRIMRDISQLELARAAGISRAHVVGIEAGRANPSLDVVDRLGDALGLELRLVTINPGAAQQQQVEPVHAWCSGYVGRRLRTAGLDVRREVPIGRPDRRGWIDLLAFDHRTATLVIVEIKTVLDDLGAVERQLGWYERSWRTAAAEFGWRPVRVVSWLLVLASADVDAFIQRNRLAMREAFPGRSPEMRAFIRSDASAREIDGPAEITRGIALIDPSSRRREWLIPTKSDGRRSGAPFIDYADAARRHAA